MLILNSNLNTSLPAVIPSNFLFPHRKLHCFLRILPSQADLSDSHAFYVQACEAW